jgi:acylpyruvate hydrolase
VKYISFELDGRPAVGELRDDTIYPLVGIDEIGPATSTDVLLAAERDLGAAVALADVALRPLVPHATKVFCVGLNYLSHVGETNRELPTYPVLFPKFASNCIAADQPILIPPETKQADYEGELAVVIGRVGRRISIDDASDHILGYAVANDVTMRDYQYKTHQWMQGKAWDGSTPIGPNLVTPDSVDVSAARIRTELNGEVVQDSDLSHLIFSIPQLIATISEFTELVPGDIILTGTPGGVGFRRDPQLFLRHGDEVVVEIDGVGRLTSTVQAEDVVR